MEVEEKTKVMIKRAQVDCLKEAKIKRLANLVKKQYEKKRWDIFSVKIAWSL